jgi:hypothetical protein
VQRRELHVVLRETLRLFCEPSGIRIFLRENWSAFLEPRHCSRVFRECLRRAGARVSQRKKGAWLKPRSYTNARRDKSQGVEPSAEIRLRPQRFSWWSCGSFEEFRVRRVPSLREGCRERRCARDKFRRRAARFSAQGKSFWRRGIYSSPMNHFRLFLP